MTPDMTEVDLQIDEAWRRFRLALGDTLAELEGQVVVTLPRPEATVPVRVIVTGHDGRLVTEFAGLNGREVVPWRPVAAIDAREADRLVAEIESAARTRYGAVHPSFLTVEPDIGCSPKLPPATEAVDDEPVQPSDPGQLRQLIARALTPLLGELPAVDDDGDLVVAFHDIPVWVLPNETAPVVHILTVVDARDSDPDALAKVTDDLNASIGLVKFTSSGHELTIVAELPAVPFVSSQLRSLFQHAATVMSDVVSELDERLAEYDGHHRHDTP